MNLKRILAIILAIILFVVILVLALRLGASESSNYSGLSNTQATTTPQGNVETVVTSDGQTKNLVVANDPAFNPRSFTAGGAGWLLSVTESQPKVFTGKLLANSGVDTYTIFLQQAGNFYTGDATSAKTNTKSEFSIQVQDGICKDEEGVSYEYGVVALFQNQTLNGCGGSVVSTTTVQ